jgi:hypothetical protein
MNPHYLTFCIQQALHRPADYVPTRLEFLVLCMGVPRG